MFQQQNSQSEQDLEFEQILKLEEITKKKPIYVPPYIMARRIEINPRKRNKDHDQKVNF